MKINFKRKMKSLLLLPILAGATITTPIILSSCSTQIDKNNNGHNIDNPNDNTNNPNDNQTQTNNWQLETIKRDNPLTFNEEIEKIFKDIVNKYVKKDNNNKSFVSDKLKTDISKGMILKLNKIINIRTPLESISVENNEEIIITDVPGRDYFKFNAKIEYTNKQGENKVEIGEMRIDPWIIDNNGWITFKKIINETYNKNKNNQVAKDVYYEFIGENEKLSKQIDDAYNKTLENSNLSGGLITFLTSFIPTKPTTPNNPPKTQNKTPQTENPPTNNSDDEEGQPISIVPLSYDGEYKYKYIEYKK